MGPETLLCHTITPSMRPFAEAGAGWLPVRCALPMNVGQFAACAPGASADIIRYKEKIVIPIVLPNIELFINHLSPIENVSLYLLEMITLIATAA